MTSVEPNLQANPFNQGLDGAAVAEAIAKARAPLTAPSMATADSAAAEIDLDALESEPSDDERGTSADAQEPDAAAAAAESDVPQQPAHGSGQLNGALASAAAASTANAADSAPARTAKGPRVSAADLAEVAGLTGQPKEEDTLLYAVPMAAPYDVLAKFKFKMKATPGGQKKGKAGRQAMDLLARSAQCTAQYASCVLLPVFEPAHHG